MAPKREIDNELKVKFRLNQLQEMYEGSQNKKTEDFNDHVAYNRDSKNLFISDLSLSN